MASYIPLAEALVKVKVVYDKSTMMQQTTSAVTDSTNIFKQQFTKLKAEARVFSEIGRHLNNAGNSIFKSFAFTGLAMYAVSQASSVLSKYLNTTSQSANVLRQQVNQLRFSFNQFMARLGHVISTSKIFKDVMVGLKKLLDSLDEKKIKKIFDTVVAMAFLGIILKVLSVIPMLIKGFKEIQMLWKSIIFYQGLSGVAGGTVRGVEKGIVQSAEKSAVKGVVAQGVTTGILSGGIIGTLFVKFKSLVEITKTLHSSMSNLSHSFGNTITAINEGEIIYISLYSKLKRLGIAYEVLHAAITGAPKRPGLRSVGIRVNDLEYTIYKEQIKVLSKLFSFIEKFREGFSKGFSKLVSFVSEWASKLSELLFIFDGIAAFMRGAGIDIKSGVDLIVTGLNIVWGSVKRFAGTILFVIDNITMTFSLFFAAIESAGVTLKGIIDMITGAGSLQDLADGLSGVIDEFLNSLVDLADKWKKKFNALLTKEFWVGDKDKKKEKDERYRFLNEKTSTTSFEGLHQSAQDYITKENYVRAMATLQKAVEENTAALNKGKGWDRFKASLGIDNKSETNIVIRNNNNTYPGGGVFANGADIGGTRASIGTF